MIIAGLVGSVRQGRNGENTIAYPATQTIAVGDYSYYDISVANPPVGPAPLTLSKLI